MIYIGGGVWGGVGGCGGVGVWGGVGGCGGVWGGRVSSARTIIFNYKLSHLKNSTSLFLN